MSKRNDVLNSPLLRKSHAHKMHEHRGAKKVKEAKELEQLDELYIQEEVDEYLKESDESSDSL